MTYHDHNGNQVRFYREDPTRRYSPLHIPRENKFRSFVGYLITLLLCILCWYGLFWYIGR